MAAPGFSGSNGGIGTNHTHLLSNDLNKRPIIGKNKFPMDISYFVNNICNLNCKHCYVAYNKINDNLNFSEWKNIFNQLINLGALTFGNVGKEPTLNWNLTKKLLLYLKAQKEEIPKLRYGMVTNGTLLDADKISELENCFPSYIDISLDGDKKAHDVIRGHGSYDLVMKNLDIIANKKLVEKIFIIFTINKLTIDAISEVISSVNKLGVQNILFSPYITVKKNDNLYLSDNCFCRLFEDMINGLIINFNQFKNMTFYIKNDYSMTLGIMQKMVQVKLINLDKLFIDEYGVIFTKYQLPNNNRLIISYIPFDNNYSQMIRISHDGYVSNCLDMFYENYPERAIGNIREKSIKEILESVRHGKALAA